MIVFTAGAAAEEGSKSSERSLIKLIDRTELLCCSSFPGSQYLLKPVPNWGQTSQLTRDFFKTTKKSWSNLDFLFFFKFTEFLEKLIGLKGTVIILAWLG